VNFLISPRVPQALAGKRAGKKSRNHIRKEKSRMKGKSVFFIRPNYKK
jgi:hypothetical protein